MPALKRMALLCVLTRSVPYQGFNFLFNYLGLLICVWRNLYGALVFLICQNNNFNSTFTSLSYTICRHLAASVRHKKVRPSRTTVKFCVICISSRSVRWVALMGRVCFQKASRRKQVIYDLWISMISVKTGSHYKYSFHQYNCMQSLNWKRILWTCYKPQKKVFYSRNVDSL